MTTESEGVAKPTEPSEPFPEPEGPAPEKTLWEPFGGPGLRFPFPEDARG